MSKYECFNHAKTFLRYHLIFSTKYRRKVLNPIRDDLLAAMKVAQEKNGNFHIEIDEVNYRPPYRAAASGFNPAGLSVPE